MGVNWSEILGGLEVEWDMICQYSGLISTSLAKVPKSGGVSNPEL